MSKIKLFRRNGAVLLMGCREAARRLRVSTRRIRELATHRGVGMKLEGRWLFTAKEVKAMTPGPPGRPKKKRGRKLAAK